jgi:O-antigen/teichoic acid export membrane protein
MAFDDLTRARVARRQTQPAFVAPRSLSLVINLNMLVLADLSRMTLGFGFWIAATQLYSPTDVGLAAGAVSMATLCIQIALLGIGSAFINHYPRDSRGWRSLLDSALSAVALTGLASAGLFLCLSASLFQDLAVIGARPFYVALFLLAAAFGTVATLLDYVSVALRRADQVLVRYVAFGVLSIALLLGLSFVGRLPGWTTVFSPWAVAACAVTALGLAQLKTAVRYRYAPRLQLRPVQRLLRTGAPNWALTLAAAAPGLAVPVVVIESLSPQANARWYAAWMMASVAYIIPLRFGDALFAELSHHPGAPQRAIRRGIRWSLVLGFLAAVVVGGLARPGLALLGAGYADAATTTLRILVLAVLPLTFIHAYYSACRASGSLREAVATAGLSGALTIAAAIATGPRYGLDGIALACVSIQAATGVWALARLRAFARRAPNGRRSSGGRRQRGRPSGPPARGRVRAALSPSRRDGGI